jgi:RpiR family carbohydrate utilization transcriptional regulator
MLDRISAALPSLSPSEQRVGKLVLEDPKAFVSLPIDELAYRSRVSKPSVLRFCRSVGYDGLVDFKRKLAGSVEEGVPFVHRSVDSDDKTADVFVKVIDNALAGLLKYRDEAHIGNIDKAVEAICRSHARRGRVECQGVGNSGIVAQDAQHKLFRLGVNAVACSDGHVQVMSATLLGPDDCLVIISNSGRTRDLLDACDIAHSKGATVIVITCSGSPLAERGDIFLAVDHQEDFDRYSPMVSRLLHLMAVDVLATAVALRLGPAVLPLMEEMKNNLRTKRDLGP